MSTLWDSVKEKLGVVLITAIVSTATIFSDKITGSIKAELNKADQRPAQQEKIAKEISALVFSVENMVEFADKGLTTKSELHFVVDPYNFSIESLRKSEYVYQAAVERYWDKSALALFEKFSSDARAVDKSFHAFNEEYSLVEAGSKSKADDVRLRPLIKVAAVAVADLQVSAKQLLSALSK